MVAELPPRKTRAVRIGTIEIGAGRPIAVQSMTATKTTDIDATTRQINDLVDSGADVVRVAVDSRKDAEALAEISRQTKANLSVDLQENYRLAELVAPFVAKLRYNPGHLYHHERSKPWQEKVRYIAGVAGRKRLRRARGSQLRLGRSRQERRFRSGRLDFAHAVERPGSLRIPRPDRLYAVLRVAQGL